MITVQLRTSTPTRRPNRAVVIHYKSYRKTLKEDFDSRCGYCGSFDKIFRRSFAIDHFIPQNPKDFKHTLPANDYYNLVYSCGYCNGAKTNKWPTKDITRANDGKVGFIDPVDPKYDSAFGRKLDGSILVNDKTDKVATYIFTELDLKNEIHKILWRLEKVDLSIATLQSIINSNGRPDLEPALNALLSEYHGLTNSLFTR